MNTPNTPIKLYRMALSGHSHRVELFASLIGVPLELVDVDLLGGEHKKPPFLAMNSFGQVPVMQDGEVTLADANAILIYLEARYGAPGQWMPRDPLGAAQVQRWLTVAAGQVAFGPAAARLNVLFRRGEPSEEQLTRANGLLAVMEAELSVTSRRSLTWPTTATSRTRRRARCRWSPTRTCAPGSPASRRCKALCR
jgi:glutathione S-transferase